ncbi:hypothetical protein AMECASPLE_027472, partial [Ameca splendens]
EPYTGTRAVSGCLITSTAGARSKLDYQKRQFLYECGPERALCWRKYGLWFILFPYFDTICLVVVKNHPAMLNGVLTKIQNERLTFTASTFHDSSVRLPAFQSASCPSDSPSNHLPILCF